MASTSPGSSTEVDRGFTVWLTGPPGAGKSTLASGLLSELSRRGHAVEVLDGDEIRALLSPELGYTKSDRDQNVARIGYIAALLARNGVATLVAAVSPYRAARDSVRGSHRTPFVEVHVECPVDVLIRRDPKGLYARALRGELPHMTGVSDPYEAPLAPEIRVRTDVAPPEESIAVVLARLVELGIVSAAQENAGRARSNRARQRHRASTL